MDNIGIIIAYLFAIDYSRTEINLHFAVRWPQLLGFNKHINYAYRYNIFINV